MRITLNVNDPHTPHTLLSAELHPAAVKEACQQLQQGQAEGVTELFWAVQVQGDSEFDVLSDGRVHLDRHGQLWLSCHSLFKAASICSSETTHLQDLKRRTP